MFTYIILLQAKDRNEYGNYESAKQCSYMALCCNIFVITSYVFTVITLVATLVPIFHTYNNYDGGYSSCTYRSSYYC